jgi:hypothetical protein
METKTPSVGEQQQAEHRKGERTSQVQPHSRVRIKPITLSIVGDSGGSGGGKACTSRSIPPYSPNSLEGTSPLKKRPWCPLSAQLGDRTQRCWDVSSPICGRVWPDTALFNRPGRSPRSVCRIVHKVYPLAEESRSEAIPRRAPNHKV